MTCHAHVFCRAAVVCACSVTAVTESLSTTAAVLAEGYRSLLQGMFGPGFCSWIFSVVFPGSAALLLCIECSQVYTNNPYAHLIVTGW